MNMKVPFIDLKREARLIEDKLIKAAQEVISSGNYINGEYVRKFEKSFASYCGVSEAISVGNGSDGLKIIIKALGLGSGDEIICPANSFIASAWSIVDAGSIPVFCDIENDLLLSINTIKKCKTDKTKAIMAVHLTGKLCDTNSLINYCKEENIFLIEDAAQSIGATNDRNQKAGSFGIAGSFSMHPLKNLAVYGDGGVITTNDADLADRIRTLRNHGLINRDESIIWGLNSRLDELQAAFACIKLQYIEEWNNKYIHIAEQYNKNLTQKIIKPLTSKGNTDVFHNYIIRVPVDVRDKIMSSLMELGVETKIHYPIPLHLQKCAASLGYKKGDIPNAEKFAKAMISLPIYHTLNNSEINHIIDSVNLVADKFI